MSAPSANSQGKSAPERVEVLETGLMVEVDLIVDGGHLPGGLPSTLVELTVWPPEILRPGATPEARIGELAEELSRAFPEQDETTGA